MNKKLIVTAMGLVLAGGMSLANADVKVYGQLDVSVNATDSDVGSNNATRSGTPPVSNNDGTRLASDIGQNGAGYSDDINLTSNTSAIGVKGSEDLGGGMSAIFKVEWDADLVNGGAFKGRDQYIGLKTEGFGKLVFGTTSTAYKSAGSKIDAFYRTPLQMRAVGLQSNLHSGKGEIGQGRGTNMVRYDSPSFSGVSVTGTYQFNSNKQKSNQFNAAPQDDDPYSLGIQYKGGGLYAAASYISTQQSNKAEAAQYIVRYDMGDLSLHGIYEFDDGLITAQANNGRGQTGKDSAGNSTFNRAGSSRDDGADIWSVGLTYKIANNLIGFDYGQRNNSNGKNNTDNHRLQGIASNAARGGQVYDDIQDYNAWRIAGYHKFSKRTRVYAGYAVTDYNNKGEDDTFSLGMRHNF